jgi:hypothetical protein
MANPSHTNRHPSPVARHASPVTRHPSPVTRHPSPHPHQARFVVRGRYDVEEWQIGWILSYVKGTEWYDTNTSLNIFELCGSGRKSFELQSITNSPSPSHSHHTTSHPLKPSLAHVHVQRSVLCGPCSVPVLVLCSARKLASGMIRSTVHGVSS